MSAPKRQTKEDREYIPANLPGGVRRVQVIEPNGKQVYKRPDDVMWSGTRSCSPATGRPSA